MKPRIILIFKFIVIEVILATFVFGCTGESGEEVDPSLTFLEITGENVELRDSNSLGNVMLRLNNGDQCRVLEQGHLEIIDGKSDYWYQIEFEERIGWVFGAYTDWNDRALRPRTPLSLGSPMILDSPSTQKLVSGATPETSWESFRNNMETNCHRRFRNAIEAGSNGEFSGSCTILDSIGLDFEWLDSYEEGYFREKFHFAVDTFANLWLVPLEWNSTENGLSHGRNTLLGMWGAEWVIYGVIEGTQLARANIGKDSTIFCFHVKQEGMDWGQEKIDIWLNIEAQKTFRKIQSFELPPWHFDSEGPSFDDSLVGLDLSTVAGNMSLIMDHNRAHNEIWNWNRDQTSFVKGGRIITE